MSDLGRLILSIVLAILALGLLIFVTVFTKKRNAYVQGVLISLEENNKNYYLNTNLLDGKYFPYHERLKSGLRHKFGVKDERDEITNITLRKNYTFFDERVIYIVNNNLHYPLNIVEIEKKKYIELDSKIKTIEILVSNERPSHFLLKFEFVKTSEGITFSVKEETFDDRSKKDN
jgi:hypothetical protein